jgi:hypothetical protein
VTGIFVVILAMGWVWREAASSEFGPGPFYVGLGSCVGAIGAFFSILTRVGRTPLDPSAGWQLHWLEGLGRILIGVVGAALAEVAMKLGLALTILSEKGFAGLFLVAFIAGFSERFVHTLIKRVEMDNEPKLGESFQIDSK